MDSTLIYLVSWVAIVIAIVVLNNRAKKRNGKITFNESTKNLYDGSEVTNFWEKKARGLL